MRYIKRYESRLHDKEDLKTFCEEHLIELIDIGFNISLDTRSYNYLQSVVCVEISMPKSTFTYDVLKNYIVTFFEIFKSEYDIVPLPDRNQNYLAKDIFINGNGVNLNQLDTLDLSKLINNMPHLKYISFLVRK